jgi:hypothetical protein
VEAQLMLPDVFKQALFGLGMTAGQLTELSDDTKQRLTRLVVGGVTSGKLDQYLNERLRWIEEREALEASPASRPAATARASVITAEFVEEPPKRGRR